MTIIVIIIYYKKIQEKYKQNNIRKYNRKYKNII